MKIQEIIGIEDVADALANRVAEAPASWLPISGHVVNITFSLIERDLIVATLREASLPTLARTLGSVT